MPIVPETPIELPQSVKDEIIAMMKLKLPVAVDDSVLLDILESHRSIVFNYIQSTKTT